MSTYCAAYMPGATGYAHHQPMLYPMQHQSMLYPIHQQSTFYPPMLRQSSRYPPIHHQSPRASPTPEPPSDRETQSRLRCVEVDNEALHKQNEALHKQNEALRKQKEALLQEKAALREKPAEVDALRQLDQYTTHQPRFDALQRRNKALVKDITALEVERDALRHQNIQTKRELERQKIIKKRELELQATQLVSMNSGHARDTASTSRKHKQEVGRLKQALATCEAENRALVSDIRDMDDINDGTRANLKEARTNLKETQATLDEVRANLEEARTQASKYQSIMSQGLTRRYDSLTREHWGEKSCYRQGPEVEIETRVAIDIQGAPPDIRLQQMFSTGPLLDVRVASEGCLRFVVKELSMTGPSAFVEAASRDAIIKDTIERWATRDNPPDSETEAMFRRMMIDGLSATAVPPRIDVRIRSAIATPNRLVVRLVLRDFASEIYRRLESRSSCGEIRFIDEKARLEAHATCASDFVVYALNEMGGSGSVSTGSLVRYLMPHETTIENFDAGAHPNAVSMLRYAQDGLLRYPQAPTIKTSCVPGKVTHTECLLRLLAERDATCTPPSANYPLLRHDLWTCVQVRSSRIYLHEPEDGGDVHWQCTPPLFRVDALCALVCMMDCAWDLRRAMDMFSLHSTAATQATRQGIMAAVYVSVFSVPSPSLRFHWGFLIAEPVDAVVIHVQMLRSAVLWLREIMVSASATVRATLVAFPGCVLTGVRSAEGGPSLHLDATLSWREAVARYANKDGRVYVDMAESAAPTRVQHLPPHGASIGRDHAL